MKKVKERKKVIAQIVIAIIGVVVGLLGVHAFNRYVLMSIPLVWRMLLMIVTYFPIALVPFCIAIIHKDKWSDYGFSKEKIGCQVLIGLGLALGMSFVFTVIPHLAGKSDWVNNQHRYQYMWQFLYDFSYYIFTIALVEEFVFRGFFYTKLKTLFGSSTSAIIGSSLLFGLFHFLGGNIAQLIATGIIGAILCICRVKIRNCTLLSLIIAHGVYDAFITVWLNVFT
ncbi:MAG: lysostaphin resistance A-like protein [Acetatifactor sp.]